MKRRIAAMALAILMALPGAGLTARAAGTDLTGYENGQVLVGYEDGSFRLFEFEDQAQLNAGLDELERDPSVALIQPNYTYTGTALSVSDELAGLQWALDNDGTFQVEEETRRLPVQENPFVPERWRMRGMAYEETVGSGTQALAGIDIGAQEAWSVYQGGNREVVVALIDTGVDLLHEDLAGAFWVNEDEIAGNGVDDDGNGYVDDVNGWNFYADSADVYSDTDQDSHGTHGAGTIAAVRDNGTGVAGIAGGGSVKIMVLKALGGRDGSGSTASVIRAIEYARDNGADICNLSLGSSVDDRALYQAMAASGMLFVAAAGNNGVDADRTPSYPACYDLDNLISVANLSYDGTLHASSNYGVGQVDLAAPGTYILSTTPENGYSYMTGTSMAAPMVTGAAAMLYSHYEDLSLADVKDVLLASAQPLESLQGKTLTGGMLDLGAAMTYDVSQISSRGWAQADVAAGAPEIRLYAYEQQGRSYLTVEVTDADGDLYRTAYAPGTLLAEDFRQGEQGTAFSVGEDGRITFAVQESGTYTFYAMDSQGNQTVETVTVRVRSGQGLSPSMPHGPGTADRRMGRNAPVDGARGFSR